MLAPHTVSPVVLTTTGARIPSRCHPHSTANSIRYSCHSHYVGTKARSPLELSTKREPGKTRHLTNWPNFATKFARRGTIRSLLLANWSSWHRAASPTQWTKFYSNDQSSTSPGESSARLPAGLQPHRHFCHR